MHIYSFNKHCQSYNPTCFPIWLLLSICATVAPVQDLILSLVRNSFCFRFQNLSPVLSPSNILQNVATGWQLGCKHVAFFSKLLKWLLLLSIGHRHPQTKDGPSESSPPSSSPLYLSLYANIAQLISAPWKHQAVSCSWVFAHPVLSALLALYPPLNLNWDSVAGD